MYIKSELNMLDQNPNFDWNRVTQSAKPWKNDCFNTDHLNLNRDFRCSRDLKFFAESCRAFILEFSKISCHANMVHIWSRECHDTVTVTMAFPRQWWNFGLEVWYFRRNRFLSCGNTTGIGTFITVKLR